VRETAKKKSASAAAVLTSIRLSQRASQRIGARIDFESAPPGKGRDFRSIQPIDSKMKTAI
jgi:hypothetical protein